MCMAQRIKERRNILGFTQEELGEKLGLQKSAIAKYENGRVENIKRSVIAKMADILECSPAYLMGWSDRVTGEEEIPNETAQKIKELRLLHKLTLEQVANEVGVGKNTVRKWETGMIANMKRDKIAALAKALHTTPAYLMGWSDESAIPPILPSLFSQIEKEYGKAAASALSLYVQLDEPDRLRVNERIQTLLENEKYSSKPKKGLSNA